MVGKFTIRYTLEQANDKLHSIFPELTLLSYEASNKLTTVRSSKCGHEWKGSLSNITSKVGGYICRTCNPPGNTLTFEKASKQLSEKLPDLELIEFTKTNSNAIVRSRTCGHTWSNLYRNIASKHSGHICRICTKAPNAKLSLEEANIRLLEISTDLEFVEYKGLQVYSLIKSKNCGHTWETSLNNINTGNTPITCPICVPRLRGTSRGEKEVLEYIKSIYSGWIIENDRDCIPPYELDIVLPDLGIAIEYNGAYFHSEDKNRLSLLDKTKLLYNNMEFRLIHIFDNEWEDKQDIVKSRIASLVGKSIKIYARKCEIKVLQLFPSEFLSTNHIQGAGSISSINLGLFYNNEIFAVMTFSKPRFNNDCDYELIRYCSKLGYTIVGGASKLLSYFRKQYTGSVVSYSDKRWSTGNLYSKLGFKLSHTSPPNYRYYRNKQSLSRYQCQKHLLKTMFPDIYSDNKTEIEIMAEAGYYRVFDCGNDVWIIK